MNKAAVQEAVNVLEKVAYRHDMTKSELEHELMKYLRADKRVVRKGAYEKQT